MDVESSVGAGAVVPLGYGTSLAWGDVPGGSHFGAVVGEDSLELDAVLDVEEVTGQLGVNIVHVYESCQGADVTRLVIGGRVGLPPQIPRGASEGVIGGRA